MSEIRKKGRVARAYVYLTRQWVCGQKQEVAGEVGNGRGALLVQEDTIWTQILLPWPRLRRLKNTWHDFERVLTEYALPVGDKMLVAAVCALRRQIVYQEASSSVPAPSK